MDIQTKYELLSDEAQRQIEGYLEYLLSKEEINDLSINIEQYNRELHEAEAAVKRGEFITHNDLKEEMKKW